MEAVTAILGSGLQVGVVLQGKKVRDDNRTLQQAGISQSSNLDSLGFALEPSFAHVSGQSAPKDLPLVLQCDAALLSSRYCNVLALLFFIWSLIQTSQKEMYDFNFRNLFPRIIVNHFDTKFKTPWLASQLLHVVVGISNERIGT